MVNGNGIILIATGSICIISPIVTMKHLEGMQRVSATNDQCAVTLHATACCPFSEVMHSLPLEAIHSSMRACDYHVHNRQVNCADTAQILKAEINYSEQNLGKMCCVACRNVCTQHR